MSLSAPYKSCRGAGSSTRARLRGSAPRGAASSFLSARGPAGGKLLRLTPLSARPCPDRLRGNPVCPLGGISWRMGRCVGSGRCVGTQAMEVAGWGSQPKCPPQPHSSRKLSGDPKAAAELSSAPSSPTASELPPKQKGSWSSHCCFLSSGSEKCIFLVN